MRDLIRKLNSLLVIWRSWVNIQSAPTDAGIKLGSSHSGRRRFASNLLSNGASLETVQQLLGHAELDHIMHYLNINKINCAKCFL
ncbi:tyrosine-type recombinase/integrase [Sapientia aquatica]|uniref:tyrosine-type recombinase/integrase n=1 Tax=Sapientia aquatica TaxID=1549640 RepID=UPI001D0DB2A6|nr:tyrosine-type recombinase/integrase [Sapientia aquatica]